MSLQIVEATEAHLVELAERLRPLDRREVQALGFAEPLDGIKESAARSVWVKAALDEGGQVAAVWGVGVYPDLPDAGGPWMLSTRLLGRHKKAFLRLSRPEIAALKREFRSLHGLVDARYRGAVRWIEWLGFHTEPFQDIGGALFLRFEWEA
jgi:hypothetical protein